MIEKKMKCHLLDIIARDSEVRLVFKLHGNGRLVLTDAYHPHFFALCSNPEQAADSVGRHPNVLSASVVPARPDIADSRERPCVKVVVDSIRNVRRTASDMAKVPGLQELMETSFPHYLRYAIEKKLSFYSEYEIETSTTNHFSITPTDSHSLPSLDSCAAIFLRGRADALTGKGKSASFSVAGLHDFLESENIDVLFACGMGETRLPLPEGCLMVDVGKDLGMDIYSEEGDVPNDLPSLLELGRRRLIRVMELSSMSSARPEMVSRVSPGRLNTFLHMRAAKLIGFLIPETKKSMERPKSLRMLRAMDKGGTVIFPEPAVYHNVGKCDFASMYPNIIVRNNISPETMHCGCGCSGIMVPESGWKICSRRKGIIPQGIEAVLVRRLALKKLKKAEKDPERKLVYDLRQRALKNILVTCFGYLGFKNFIFSNVECKECVMLFGRHILMRAKEIAEQEGLEVIYGIVDSVFVKNGDEKKYREYVRRVSEEIGIELELDCVFSKIAFPCAEDSAGIANKYYGITREGELEARGIALRHSDCPAFISEFQEKAVRIILAEGELGRNVAVARMLLDECRMKVARKEFPIESFAITKPLRRQPDEYVVDAPHVVAFRQMPNDSGSVIYVHTLRGPKPLALANKAELSSSKYVEMLERGFDELVRGLAKGEERKRLAEFC